jgi:multiple sugar transport system permease protein
MSSSTASRRVFLAADPLASAPWSQWLRRVQPLLYLLPALIAVGIWVYRPLVQTFVLSFYEWNLLPTSPQTFVGLQNYSRIFQLPDMTQALSNTAIYIVGLWPLAVVLPALIAIATDELGKRAREIYRVLIFAPMMMAPVVVAAVWRWILHPTNGIVNNTLNGLVNDFERIRFFTDGSIAIWVIIFITGWKLTGFSTLIFSAALTNINRDIYEASAIDGATRWQNLRFITIPLLSPTILFMTMLSILFASAWSFTYINVLTDGGPSGATTNIYYLLWVYGFRSFAIGWSSAAAMVIFVVFGIVAFLLIRLSNRLAFYDN